MDKLYQYLIFRRDDNGRYKLLGLIHTPEEVNLMMSGIKKSMRNADVEEECYMIIEGNMACMPPFMDDVLPKFVVFKGEKNG